MNQLNAWHRVSLLAGGLWAAVAFVGFTLGQDAREPAA
jgi:hypothetical protein